MKNNIKYCLVEFFAKLGIMCVMALTLGIICAFIEVIFKIDTTVFVYFTMGYLSHAIYSWRWFICQEGKRKK